MNMGPRLKYNEVKRRIEKFIEENKEPINLSFGPHHNSPNIQFTAQCWIETMESIQPRKRTPKNAIARAAMNHLQNIVEQLNLK